MATKFRDITTNTNVTTQAWFYVADLLVIRGTFPNRRSARQALGAGRVLSADPDLAPIAWDDKVATREKGFTLKLRVDNRPVSIQVPKFVGDSSIKELAT